ncbi:prephenate dehydratase, partial [Bacillus subtilis]
KAFDDVLIKVAMQELEAHACKVKLLGAYQSYQL